MALRVVFLAQLEDVAGAVVIAMQAQAAVLVGALLPPDGPFQIMRPQLELRWSNAAAGPQDFVRDAIVPSRPIRLRAC